MGRTKSRKPTVPLKSNPGIPKLPSLKQRNEVKQRARPALPTHKSDPDSIMVSEPTFQDPSLSSGVTGKTKERIRKHYLRTLHKVIDEADIVIARDPEGCRSRLVEEEVRRRESEGKKLVFVLNKVDLIPRVNAQAWLKHLRHNTPTLPFLSPSAAQHQRTNISSSTAPQAGSVTVGVVGYPNVGKSSLINSLKRNKVCPVAAQPGHTKELQSVQLERGMRIVDSPGVVFDEDDEDFKGQKKGSVLLRNVVKVEDVDDPIAVVEEILLRTEKETIQKIYSLPDFTAAPELLTMQFLTMLALSSGRLLKGGSPDILSAARQVLADWNHQKIPYFSVPPTIHPSSIPSTIPAAPGPSSEQIIAPGAENVGQAQILSTFSKPFELEGLFGAADAGAFGSGGGDVDMNGADTGAGADGDEMFWDANEEFDNDVGMQEDAEETISPEDLASRRTSLGKRARSPSVQPAPIIATDPSQAYVENENENHRYQRQPKRQRKSNRDAPLEAVALQGMEQSNPLNRRVLKKERKRERKLARHKNRDMMSGSGAGMEIDDMALTFIA
ncbi:hypothetical protein BT96DRAFT_960120 [Gymnopus androsaceus JB14]|uniref:CP-type G domain-containing protein n=1 Tax=Gymnopus androsaceus JB14 TaxID=1447944 RepID=A0A6A4GT91_9AGAR|nr:hypothetical protein BT96DRAFT_960120 [Gymnopus androsaceus JB14]